MNALFQTRAPADLVASNDGDRPWLIVMAVAVAFEFVWWLAAWRAGIAPPPFIGTYTLLAIASLTAALALRQALRRAAPRSAWSSVFSATALVALGASLFLPLKYAIPREIPFWLDQPLARGEHMLLGVQPWALLDRLLGWAVVPVDRLYATWLPTQSLALFSIILAAPGRAKSRALIAYSLGWLLLGVVAAVLLSSAGPLFFNRLYGTEEFLGLRETLRARGAWMALAESDAMWRSLASGQPGIVAGVSAMPSIHVAISLWMVLAARGLAPRVTPFAWAYFAFIWIASVQLGWHYAVDGLGGAAGMLAVWALAGWITTCAFPTSTIPPTVP